MTKLISHFHNKFELTLKRGGEVLQKAYAENVVLNNIWSAFAVTYYDFQPFNSVALGTGSGTPSTTDTALFNLAFVYDALTQVSRTIGYPTSTLVLSASIPATSSYTGNLTEIGLRSAQMTYNPVYYLITHAMLKDAEGNPITITKTDLDILEITATVYCTITNAIAGFTLVSADSNNILARLSISATSGPMASSIQGCTLARTCIPTESYVEGIALTTSTTFSTATKILSYTLGRVVATSGNTHYYNGMLFKGWGMVRFPNSTFFPAYTISGMSVGTGDGATTEFKSPLNLFVPNSETIYVNGVAATRGTEYTIEHNANVDKLVTASAGNRAAITQKAAPVSGQVVNTARPFSIGVSSDSYFLSATTPLVLQLDTSDTSIGTKVNRIDLGYLAYVGFTTYSHAGLVFIASYSADGDTWTEAGRLTVSVTTTNVNYGSITFDAVTAEYWKISLDTSGILNATVRSIANTRPLYQTTSGTTFLGYVGGNITFASAPAADAIITMDAQVDRPFKNRNFVIDTTASLGFTGP